MDLIDDRTELHVSNLPNPNVVEAEGIPDAFRRKDERFFVLPGTNDVVTEPVKTGLLDKVTDIVYNLIK